MNNSTSYCCLMQNTYCTDIAGDLHDHIGQRMFVTNMLLDKCSRQTNSKIIKEKLLTTREQLLCTMDHMRSLCSMLNILRKNNTCFLLALDMLAFSFEKAAGFSVHMPQLDIPGELRQHARENIYRVFQEAFTNILKHAQAQNVTVTVNGSVGALRITVHDDGKGAHIDSLKPGNGMYHIKQRVHNLNGSIQFSSVPGKYFQLELEFPLQTICMTQNTTDQSHKV